MITIQQILRKLPLKNLTNMYFNDQHSDWNRLGKVIWRLRAESSYDDVIAGNFEQLRFAIETELMVRSGKII